MAQGTRGTSPIQPGPHEPGMYRRCGYWCDYSEREQRATAALLLPSYAAKATDRARFAAERGLDPASPECAAAWRAQLAEWERLLQSSYGDRDIVYTVFLAIPAGTPIALATAMVSFGARETPIGGAVGDHLSSIQTLRLLEGFGWGDDLGLDPYATPEREVAEMGRLCVRADESLAELTAGTRLTRAGRDYIRRKGSSEALAGAYFGAQAWADNAEPPRALACFLYTTPKRLGDYLAAIGVPGRPLYVVSGAAPTARARGGPALVSNYFTWVLPPIVPAAIQARGIAAGIHFLANDHPEVLRSLPFSLPYFMLNDAALRAAMRRLWDGCGLAQDPPAATWLAAD